MKKAIKGSKLSLRKSVRRGIDKTDLCRLPDALLDKASKIIAKSLGGDYVMTKDGSTRLTQLAKQQAARPAISSKDMDRVCAWILLAGAAA